MATWQLCHVSLWRGTSLLSNSDVFSRQLRQSHNAAGRMLSRLRRSVEGWKLCMTRYAQTIIAIAIQSHLPPDTGESQTRCYSIFLLRGMEGWVNVDVGSSVTRQSPIQVQCWVRFTIKRFEIVIWNRFFELWFWFEIIFNHLILILILNQFSGDFDDFKSLWKMKISKCWWQHLYI